MSVFDSLSSGSFLQAKAPAGYRARQREQTPSPERDDMDAKVIAAGGDIGKEWQQSGGKRPGRPMGRQQEISWYLIPEDQFDQP